MGVDEGVTTLSSLVGDAGVSWDDVRSIDCSGDAEKIVRFVESAEIVLDEVSSSTALLGAVDGTCFSSAFTCLGLDDGCDDDRCLIDSVEFARGAESSSDVMGVAAFEPDRSSTVARCVTEVASFACFGLGGVVVLPGCADLANFAASATACFVVMSTDSMSVETMPDVDG